MTSENRERAAARSADIRAEPRLRPVIYSAKPCYVSLRSIRMRTPLRHSRTPLALPAPRAARPIGPSRGVPHTFAGRRAARVKGRAGPRSLRRRETCTASGGGSGARRIPCQI